MISAHFNRENRNRIVEMIWPDLEKCSQNCANPVRFTTVPTIYRLFASGLQGFLIGCAIWEQSVAQIRYKNWYFLHEPFWSGGQKRGRNCTNPVRFTTVSAIDRLFASGLQGFLIGWAIWEQSVAQIRYMIVTLFFKKIADLRFRSEPDPSLRPALVRTIIAANRREGMNNSLQFWRL